MPRNIFISIVAILVFLIGASFALLVWNPSSQSAASLLASGEKPHVTVGIQTSPAMALVMVAKDEGFFNDRGLDVEIKEFTAGKFALEAFLGGSLDFAVSGDVPVTLSALQGSKFVVPAQVVRQTVNEVRVVALDDGSKDAQEYFTKKKRKLATSFGGGPEFFTYEFLRKLGVSDNVELISQTPNDMPAALASKSIDAVAIFDPFAFIAEQQLGNASVTYTDESIYSELYVIEAQMTAVENPIVVEALLRGLIDAQSFTANNPEKAKQIVMKYTKLDKETVDGIWGSFDFRVALTPQLLDYLEREVAWAKDTGKVPSDTPSPDFHSIIFDVPLRNVAPSAVEL